jgi:hypothetical protein
MADDRRPADTLSAGIQPAGASKQMIGPTVIDPMAIGTA